jgi:hypothetical protein
MDPQIELIIKVAGVAISLGALLVGVARFWVGAQVRTPLGKVRHDP